MMRFMGLYHIQCILNENYIKKKDSSVILYMQL